MMDFRTGIHEPMVVIPWWMDCSYTKLRHRPDMTRYIQAMIDSDQAIPIGTYKIRQTIALSATQFMEGKRTTEHQSEDNE